MRNIILIGVIGFLVYAYQQSEDTWNTSSKNHLGGAGPSVSSSSNGNVLEFACRGDTLEAHVYWGQQMDNIYPDSSVPTATKIVARFSTGDTWEMGWTHERGGLISGAPKTQLGISSALDSAIFGLLGFESTATRNSKMFNWKSIQLLQRLIDFESNSPQGFFRLVSNDSSGRTVSARFEAKGLYNQIKKGMTSCVHFN